MEIDNSSADIAMNSKGEYHGARVPRGPQSAWTSDGSSLWTRTLTLWSLRPAHRRSLTGRTRSGSREDPYATPHMLRDPWTLKIIVRQGTRETRTMSSTGERDRTKALETRSPSKEIDQEQMRHKDPTLGVRWEKVEGLRQHLNPRRTKDR